MFNLYPGQGVGRETSNILAFGLGSWLITAFAPVCEFTKSVVVREFSRIKTVREFFINGR